MNVKEKIHEMGYVVIPEAIEKEEIEIIRNFYTET